MTEFRLIARIDDPLPPPLQMEPPTGRSVRIGAVQCGRNPDPYAHRGTLAEGIRMAADQGAAVVCFLELTLAPYLATAPDAFDLAAQDIGDGPTATFAREMASEGRTIDGLSPLGYEYWDDTLDGVADPQA